MASMRRCNTTFGAGGQRMGRSEGTEGHDVITVLVIDDHELISSALRAVFDQDGRARVVATAGSISEGLAATRARRPDVVLTDRRLPDGDMDERISDLR